jgi:hypothetical protein
MAASRSTAVIESIPLLLKESYYCPRSFPVLRTVIGSVDGTFLPILRCMYLTETNRAFARNWLLAPYISVAVGENRSNGIAAAELRANVSLRTPHFRFLWATEPPEFQQRPSEFSCGDGLSPHRTCFGALMHIFKSI